MSNTPQAPRQWSDVVLNGTNYHLIAFYFPDDKHKYPPAGLTPWDDYYRFEEFGNFWICPKQITITIGGVSGSFHTAEAAFQATKWWQYKSILQDFESAADGPAAYKAKVKAEAAHAADRNYGGLGQDPHKPTHKSPGECAMRAILDVKYESPSLQSLLLESGDAYLLEHNDRHGKDHTWSDDQDGTGGNQLGLTLMDVRASLGGPGMPAGADGHVAAFTSQVQTK